MANAKLVVEVIGDSTKLDLTLKRTQAETERWARKISTTSTSGGGAASRLLADTRAARLRSEELTRQLQKQREEADRTAASVGRSYTKLAIGGLIMGQVARQATAELSKQNTEVGRTATAFSALLNLDVIGFFKAARQEVVPTVEALQKGQSIAQLNAIATLAAADGYDKLATAARNAAAGLRDQSAALIASTQAANLAAAAVRTGLSGDALDASQFGERTDRFGRGVGAVAEAASRAGQTKEQAEAEKRRRGITTSQRNQFFDNSLTRALDRSQDGSPADQLAKLKAISDTITQRLAVTKDITRKLRLEDELVAVGRQRQGIIDQVKEDAAQRARELKALAEQQEAERKQRERERIAREKAAAETRLAQRTARQFRELGLGADGNEITPSSTNLRKRVAQLTSGIEGTKLDTPKLESQLARFRKVLSEGLVPKDVRAKIKQMVDDIADELHSGATKGPLTQASAVNTDRILSGLGLGRDAERIARARLSHFNTAGVGLAGSRSASTATVVTNVTLKVDGDAFERTVTRKQQERGRRSPEQTRGRSF